MADDHKHSNAIDMKSILTNGMRNMLGSTPRKTAGSTVEDRQAGERKARKPNDGRRLKRGVRTEQLNMRVTVEFKDRLFEIANTEGIYMTEVLERALEVYEKSRAQVEGK